MYVTPPVPYNQARVQVLAQKVYTISLIIIIILKKGERPVPYWYITYSNHHHVDENILMLPSSVTDDSFPVLVEDEDEDGVDDAEAVLGLGLELSVTVTVVVLTLTATDEPTIAEAEDVPPPSVAVASPAPSAAASFICIIPDEVGLGELFPFPSPSLVPPVNDPGSDSWESASRFRESSSIGSAVPDPAEADGVGADIDIVVVVAVVVVPVTEAENPTLPVSPATPALGTSVLSPTAYTVATCARYIDTADVVEAFTSLGEGVGVVDPDIDSTPCDIVSVALALLVVFAFPVELSLAPTPSRGSNAATSNVV